jgi:hypothetical protein
MTALSRSTHVRKVGVALLFLVALAARLPDLNVPGTGMSLDRDYHSALIARAYYYQISDSVPEWKRIVAETSRQRRGLLEPPITELAAALLYRIAGGEYLWVARLLTCCFWLTGGIFLFKIAERLISFGGAVYSLAYYLTIPIGVQISRSFQPDSLMMMTFLLSLLLLLWYIEHPTMRKLLVTAAVTGLTIMIRPFTFFPLMVTFATLTIFEKKTIAALLSRSATIFVLLGVLPTALFYGYGYFFTGQIEREVGLTIMPELLLRTTYWTGWMYTATNAVGAFALVFALFALALLRRGTARAVQLGLGIGYVLFCLVFTNHVTFSQYYHLQLVIFVALGIGVIAKLIFDYVKRSPERWIGRLALSGAILVLVSWGIKESRLRIRAHPKFEKTSIAREIGEIVGHGTRNVYVAVGYGMPLEYYAELSGRYWPRKLSDRDAVLRRSAGERTVVERLANFDFEPDYFIITHLEEFERHHQDLRAYLGEQCTLVSQSDQFLIYRGCPHREPAQQ